MEKQLLIDVDDSANLPFLEHMSYEKLRDFPTFELARNMMLGSN
jgi:hypothetical protein